MRTVEGGTFTQDTLGGIEEILEQSGIDHRIVGGVIAHPITLDTQISLNVTDRRVELSNYGEINLIRSDGSVRDVDSIGFARHLDLYDYARRKLGEAMKDAQKNDRPFPPVSIEATHYSDWPKRNRLLQFVSTIDIDEDENPHLTFGAVDQCVDPRTLEPWTIIFNGSLSLTSINLYGIPKRYYMRNASGIKRKDSKPVTHKDGIGYSKIGILEQIAQSVQDEGLKQGVDYSELYASWDEFIDNLLHHADTLTKMKASVTRFYWNTIGEAMSHGGLAGLGDRFTG